MALTDKVLYHWYNIILLRNQSDLAARTHAVVPAGSINRGVKGAATAALKGYYTQPATII